MYSYGHIIREVGCRLHVPELENLGVRIMQSRLQDRADGGALSAETLISELRSHTFRAGLGQSTIAPVDCYELSKQLQARAPGIVSYFAPRPEGAAN